MSRLLIHGLFVCLILVMVGCKTTGKSNESLDQLTVLGAEDILKHKRAIQAQPNWSFHGRVAVKQGSDGGSARIDWLQRGDTLRIDLSTPISRQSMRISAVNDQSICIDGLEQRRLCGPEAQAQLGQVIGEIPLFMLRDWVRGLPVSAEKMFEAGLQPAIVSYNQHGYLEMLSQNGWQIHYQTWHLASDTQPRLPKRLEATKENMRLRLVIDRWIWGADEQ